ncbi:MAG: hypothetical protein V8S42_06775 [Lachnospiraceae bacterium]
MKKKRLFLCGILEMFAASEEEYGRMNRKDAETVPIFAMSANAFDDDVARSRAAGMNGRVSKPLSFEKAAAVIAQYVRKK